MSKNLRDLLKSKTNQDLPENFDSNFWNKFESEFQKERPRSWFSKYKYIWIALPAALAVVLYINIQNNNMLSSPEFLNQTEEIQLLAESEMLDDMEIYLEFEDIALQDSDWEELLSENTGG